MHLTYRLGDIAAPTRPAPPTAAHYRAAAALMLALTAYGLLIPLRYRTLTRDEAWAAFRGIAFFDPKLLGARGDWVASVVQFAALGFLATGAVAVALLMPFDFVVGAGELAQKYREGKITLGLAGPGEMLPRLALNLLLFLPAGLLPALARPHASWLRNRKGVLYFGLAAAALLEVLQMLVYSRYASLLDVATGAGGVLLGWRLARGVGLPAWVGAHTRRLARRAPDAWAMTAVVWFAAVAAVNWQPFDFSADPARFREDGELTDEQTAVVGLRRLAWAPLVDYYWSSKYNAADQFLKKTAAFVPLGVLLGLHRRFGRPGGAALAALVALLAGLAIEAGQYFIPARHPSTTDLLLAVLGALLGLAAVRRAAVALQSGPTPSWGHA